MEKIKGQWQYFLADCWDEFQNEFPGVVDYNTFRCSLHRSLKLFRETGRNAKRRKWSAKKAYSWISSKCARNNELLVRALAQQTGVSIGTNQTLLRKDLHLFPYRITAVQKLLETDYPRWVEICEWLLTNFDGDLFNKTFFSDEAWFHLSGYVNTQNMRMWCAEKPEDFYVEAPHHPQKVGVWCAVSRRRIVGPIFFHGTLTGQRYREEVLTPFIHALNEDELDFLDIFSRMQLESIQRLKQWICCNPYFKIG